MQRVRRGPRRRLDERAVLAGRRGDGAGGPDRVGMGGGDLLRRHGSSHGREVSEVQDRAGGELADEDLRESKPYVYHEPESATGSGREGSVP